MGVDMLFILLLALILFGPKRLPEIAREVGKFMAEFKRASNDFKYQLQAEIDKASTHTPSSSAPGGQQSSSSTPTLLPPATLAATPADASSAGSEADSEHERLMRTARMAYEAQSFSLRPPEPPPVASTVLQPTPGPQGQPSEDLRSQESRSQDQQADHASAQTAQSPAVSLPFAPAGPNAESRPAPPAEGFAAQPANAQPATAQPSIANDSADPAHESGNSALQNS